ncbi:MAG TPA: hypothetical protein VF667_10555, partial [Pseudonocardia sp.]
MVGTAAGRASDTAAGRASDTAAGRAADTAPDTAAGTAPGGGGAGAGPVQSWPGLLGRLVAGHDLGTDDTAWVMDRVLSGEATAAQLAGFL